MPLAGGTFTGDVTFTGDSSNGLWDKSASAFVGNLTGTASNNAVLTGSTNNTIATVTGANALAGEANLTYDGTDLVVNGSGDVAIRWANGGTNKWSIFNNSSGGGHQLQIFDNNGSGVAAAFNTNGAVELYHDNSKSLETTATGCTIQKTASNQNADLVIDATNGGQATLSLKTTISGTNRASRIDFFNQDSNQWTLVNDYDQNGDNEFGLRHGAEKAIIAKTDGAVELYHDNVKTFETNSSGVKVTGQLELSSHAAWPDHSSGYVGKAVFGGGDDLQIYHDGSNSRIKNSTGGLYLEGGGGNIHIRPVNAKQSITAYADGAVELYHNNIKKIETALTGGVITHSSAASTLKLYRSDTPSDNDVIGDLFFLGKQSDGTDKTYGFIRSTVLDVTSGTTDSKLTFATKTNGSDQEIVFQDGGATFAGTVSDSIGNLRKIPQQNEQGSAHTLVAADAGKHILADATVTIPNNIFSTGDAVTIVNASGSEITLTSQLSSYLYNSGTAAEGSKKLAARGMATIIFLTATGAYISGSGLSDA